MFKMTLHRHSYRNVQCLCKEKPNQEGSIMQLDTKKLMTIYTAATAFQVERSTLYKRIHSGTLVGYEVNNKMYVNAEDLMNWKENLNKSRRHEVSRLVAELWQEGLPDSDIAVRVGRSRERVRQIRNRMGKPANPRRAKLPKGWYLP